MVITRVIPGERIIPGIGEENPFTIVGKVVPVNPVIIGGGNVNPAPCVVDGLIPGYIVIVGGLLQQDPVLQVIVDVVVTYLNIR